MDKFKGYKTVVFNLIIGCIAALQQFGGADIDTNAVEGALSDIEQSLIWIAAAGNIILRAVTTSPWLKQKE